MLLGGCISTLISGVLSDKMGRKYIILISDLFIAGGSVVMFLGLGIGFLELGRFLIGIGVGANLSVTNIYLSESSPSEIRGSITAIYLFGNFFGFILAYGFAIILEG
jgi:SP family myo-inositol transporter-like MFS transporter 13